MKGGIIRNGGIFFCVLLLAAGLGLRIYSSIASVTNYPFPTDWSEAWRIFEAASVFGQLVFDQKIPLPWQDPARAMLEGLVFLIPGGEIWMYRLWKVLLLFGTTILVSIVSYKIARKRQSLAVRGKIIPVIIIGWGVLFLLQPPINYHVLLGILPVLIFFNTTKPVRTMIAIIVASLWEGLGRINWFFMPALVASALYFLQVPVKGKFVIKYLLQPFIWGVAGAAASFSAYFLCFEVNGYISTIFTPGMEYHYFSFKLWPNPGFNLGLIPGMIILSLPLGVLILWAAWKQGKGIHWVRTLGLLAIFLVLFFGSTIISLRSGGGFDLHNYDTFILFLFLVGLFFGMKAVKMEEVSPGNQSTWLEKPFLLSLLLLVPLYFSQRDIPELVLKDETLAYQSIAEMNAILLDPGRTDKPILYTDQRQLLVYGEQPPGEIFVPYDKLYLMEMAMANYSPYLDQFTNDIQDQKFSYIVSDPLTIWFQDGRAVWGYENNVYVEYISLPILEYYQPVYLNKDFNVAIYAPIVIGDE